MTQLKARVQAFLKEYAKPTLDGWAWLDIDDNHKVVLEWQDGFDKEDSKTNKFITDDGFGLDVSIRLKDNSYFSCDSPYPSYEDGTCITGISLSNEDEEDKFNNISDYIVNLYNEAVELYNSKQVV